MLQIQFLQPQENSIKMISTVTGEAISGKALTPEYWSTQIRRSVYFNKAITAAIKVLVNSASLNIFRMVAQHLLKYLPILC